MSRDAPSASFPSRSGNAETKQFDYAECEKKLKEATELILSANELLKVSKFVKISLKLAKQNLEKSASGLFQKWQSLKNCDDYATIDHYRSKIYDKVKEIREVVVNISNVFKKLNSDKIVSFSDTVTTVVVGYCRLDGTPKSKTPSFNNGNNPSSSS
uniref:Uncharacterized protein n=1 Tax=Panagrolaimus sp. ES5 TaxID=591445 RepID=A0AC34FVX1_9BILA